MTSLDNALDQFAAAGGTYVIDDPNPSFTLNNLSVTLNDDGTEQWSDDEDGYQPERGSWAGRYAAYQARAASRFRDAYPGIDDMIEATRAAASAALSDSSCPPRLTPRML